MKKLFVFFVVATLAVSCTRSTAPINIIPQPSEIKVDYGNIFTISNKTLLLYNKSELHDVAGYFQDILAESGIIVQVQPYDSLSLPKNYICFSGVEQKELGHEGYNLLVSPSEVHITANRPAGAFYAVQTLRQLLPIGFEQGEINFKKLDIPCLSITDCPKFAWRGLHLDCCRHFMQKEFVMRYIDLIAYHKLNTLHWHLTDDQGWRIEIESYPKLNEVGSWRIEADGSKHGGFYTKEDIREIVAYATERFVNIVPEIEMPGHAVAAIASYPQLSCIGEKIEVENSWGVFKDIFCAGNEFTYSFLEKVLDEVVELFPSPYIHIGGDEAPKYRWENCPRCRALLQNQKLNDFEDMQRYFIERIGAYLEQKGRHIIGWDEIMDGGLPHNAMVQAWRGIDKVKQAVEDGAKVIAMPTSHCYLDYPIGVTDLRKSYSFDPIPQGITSQQESLIYGGECALWTEHSPQEFVDSKIFPRLLAICEVLWSYPQNRDYEQFRSRVRQHYSRLTELGVRYGFEQNAVEFHNLLSDDGGVMTVEIEGGQDNLDIHYTTDGSNPTIESESYRKPFELKGMVEVRAAAFSGNTQVDEVFINRVHLSKTTARSLMLNYTPAKQYLGGSSNALVDGRKGSAFYNDGVWQAVQGTTDMQATVTFEQMQTISTLSVGFLQSNPSWIFAPAKVEFYVSTNGTDFIRVAEVISPIKPHDGGNIVHDFEAQIEPIACNAVRMVATSIGPCPLWHPAAGSPSWLFADEFVVE